MSWLLSGNLQSSLGSLKSQVASSLKEVFEAADEDDLDEPELDNPDQDPVEKLDLAKRRIRDLKDSLEAKKIELARLQKQIEEMAQQKKFFDEQREMQRDQFKELLKDKEEEIQTLMKELDNGKDQNLDPDEIGMLNNQIESLQNCLAEVKEQHRKEMEDLTKSFLSQTSTSSKLQNGFDKNSIIEERDKLQLQIETLQRSLSEERSKSDQQVNHHQNPDQANLFQNSDQQVNPDVQIQIEHLQNALTQERDKHRREMQEALFTVGEEKSALQIEIESLKHSLNKSQADGEQAKELLQNALFDEKVKHKKEISDTVCQFEQEKQRLQQETEHLKITVDKLTAENASHAAAIKEASYKHDNEIEQLTARLAQTESEKEELLSQLNSLKLNDSSHLLETVSEEKTALAKEVHELKITLSIVQNQRDRLDSEYATLKHHHHRLVALQNESPKPSIDYEKENEYKAQIEELETTVSQMLREQEQMIHDLHNLKSNLIDPSVLELTVNRHRYEMDRLAQRLDSKHQHEKHLLESDFQMKINQLMESSDIELNQVRQRLEDKQVEFERLESETKVLESENEKLLQQVETQMNISKELQHKLESAEESNTNLSNELSSLKNLDSEYSKCFADKEEARNEKMLLENECSDLKEKLENLLKDFGNLKAELQSNDSNEHNTTKEAIKTLEKERDLEFQRLRNQLQERENEIQRLVAEHEQINRQILQTDSSQNSQHHQAESLQKLIDEERVKHRDAVSELTGAVQQQQLHSNDLSLQVVQLQSQLEKLTTDVATKENEVSNLSAQLNELRVVNQDLCNESDSWSKAANSFEQANNTLKAKLQMAEENNASLSGELSHLKALELKLEQTLSEKEEILRQKCCLEAEASRLRDEQVNLVRDVEEMRQQLQMKEAATDLASTVESLNLRLNEFYTKEQSWLKESECLMAKIAECQNQQLASNEQIEQMSAMNHNLKLSFDEKAHDLEMAKRNIQELSIMVEEKNADTMSEQQHKMQSIAAIQELQSQLSQTRKDRDAAQARMADRDRELQELKREVNNVIEKKRKLEQELGRLKQHLLSIEETGTQDVLAYETRERELKKKLQVTEEALRVASVQQSSATKESSAHLHVLEAKVVDLTLERDKIAKKFQGLNFELNKKSRALQNLEMALAGLQEEKKNEIKIAEHTYNQMLENERQRQSWLENEVKVLQERVKKTDQVLAAANSLGEQVASKNQIISGLKQEIKLKDELLQKAQEEFGDKAVNNARFERNLVKNLIVSYFQADAKQKTEVLGLIAKVLGFDEDERIKTGLDGPGYGLRYLRNMIPGSARASESDGAAGKIDLSLAEAFVKFLENESTPKTPIRLPAEEMAEEASKRSRKSSASSTCPSLETSSEIVPKSGSPNPLVMAGNSGPGAMPSLPTFSVNRSSSAILRHVLQEEEQQ